MIILLFSWGTVYVYPEMLYDSMLPLLNAGLQVYFVIYLM